MKKISLYIIGLCIISLFTASQEQKTVNVQGKTIETRILPPSGFSRESYATNSFAYYLRNLPLKSQDAKVKLYDGTIKSDQRGVFSVVDMEIGNTDLQQCADAIIRLRAEYLWKQKRYADIHFNFTNGTRIDYVKWAEGNRIKVRGASVTWEKTAVKDYSYITFRKYLDKIFMYSGTASLIKELVAVPYANMQPGDVFILGGNPGHAMIVVDVAVNAKTKQKAFVCAQSFMPAQEIHIVKNLKSTDLSPWYLLNKNDINVEFPDWTFTTHQLYRFK